MQIGDWVRTGGPPVTPRLLRHKTGTVVEVPGPGWCRVRLDTGGPLFAFFDYELECLAAAPPAEWQQASFLTPAAPPAPFAPD